MILEDHDDQSLVTLCESAGPRWDQTSYVDVAVMVARTWNNSELPEALRILTIPVIRKVYHHLLHPNQPHDIGPFDVPSTAQSSSHLS